MQWDMGWSACCATRTPGPSGGPGGPVRSPREGPFCNSPCIKHWRCSPNECCTANENPLINQLYLFRYLDANVWRRKIPRKAGDTLSKGTHANLGTYAAQKQTTGGWEKMTETQKAWFYNEYGSLDVLQFGDFPLRTPGPGEVLVKVKAAALNPVDFKRREGLVRNADSDFPTVPGCDVSGVVVDVGEGVTRFRKGDHVYGDIQDFSSGKPKQLGTLAQYTVAEETLFASKPANLSSEEAAGLPLVLLTAQQAFDSVDFREGQTVFIVGGSGGVGSIAIQLAKHVYGASRIVATASTGKLEFVRSLGADDVVDYTKQSYDQIPEKFDFVFDTIGDSLKSHAVAKEEAKMVDIASSRCHPKAKFFFVTPRASNLEKLRGYIESGKVKLGLDPKSPFAFSEVVEAFRLLESGRARRKIVISPIE